MAIQYMSMPPILIKGLGYILVVVGGGIGGLFAEGGGRMQRVPYFVMLTLITTLVGAVQYSMWLDMTDAIRSDYSWIFMLVDLTSSLVTGYFCSVLAMARSRDAFGHARYAFLNFVPVASLVLLFKAPRGDLPTAATGPRSFLQGGKGLIVGLILQSVAIGLATALALAQKSMVSWPRSVPHHQPTVGTARWWPGAGRLPRCEGASARIETPVLSIFQTSARISGAGAVCAGGQPRQVACLDVDCRGR